MKLRRLPAPGTQRLWWVGIDDAGVDYGNAETARLDRELWGTRVDIVLRDPLRTEAVIAGGRTERAAIANAVAVWRSARLGRVAAE